MLELDGAALTVEDFTAKCLVPNVPAVIRRCAGLFDSTGRLAQLLQPAALVETFGPHHKVPVSGSLEYIGAFFDGGNKTTATNTMKGDDIDLDDHNVVGGDQGMTSSGVRPYLKDWHFALELSQLGSYDAPPYSLPSFVRNDWLNSYCLRPRDSGAVSQKEESVESLDLSREFGEAVSDYRFAYIGEEGTHTLLHYDVFGSYSWSLNVHGEKLWLFPTAEANEVLRERFPPGCTKPHPVDLRVTTDIDYYSVTQRAGDLVFVPSHYFHQVHNVAGAALLGCTRAPLVASINHNWINEFCILRSVAMLCSEARAFARMAGKEAKAALQEDWVGIVNRSLLASGSWNLDAMAAFLAFCRRHTQLLGHPLSEGSLRSREELDKAERLLSETMLEVL
jgi:hypothetical protein